MKILQNRQDFFEITYTNQPNKYVLQCLHELKNKYKTSIRVAEIGIGSCRTTEKIIELLDENDILDLFDFNTTFNSGIQNYLKQFEPLKINCFAATKGTYDSYVFNLAELLLKGEREIYDLIYLDGNHHFDTDCLALFLIKPLLKKYGYIVCHDYNLEEKLLCDGKIDNYELIRFRYPNKLCNKNHVEVAHLLAIEQDEDFIFLGIFGDGKKIKTSIAQKIR